MDSNLKFHLVPLIIIILALGYRIFGPCHDCPADVCNKAVVEEAKPCGPAVAQKESSTENKSEYWIEPKDKTIGKIEDIDQSLQHSMGVKTIDYSKKNDVENFVNLFALDYICSKKYPSVWGDLDDSQKDVIKDVERLVISKNIKNVIPSDVSYTVQFLESVDNRAKLELLYSGKDYTGASKVIKLIKVGEEWKIYSLPGVIE